MQQKIPITPKAVVLVNRNDEVLGYAEKIHAHHHALLHRAFSVFVFNQHNQLLLQQRAASKYHCAGLWTNTCCSHALPDEPIEKTAHSRLIFEMGINTPLSFVDTFYYKAKLTNMLWEHELDHVFIGWSDQAPHPAPDEVCATRWVDLPELEKAIQTQPEAYTPWLTQAVAVALTHPHFQQE